MNCLIESKYNWWFKRIAFADHAVVEDMTVQDLVQRGLKRPAFSKTAFIIHLILIQYLK